LRVGSRWKWEDLKRRDLRCLKRKEALKLG